MTSTSRRPSLPALTGLRAIAAGWVVLFHYRDDLLALVPGLAPLDTFMRAGYLGVDLFFPLSGFVLAYTYADRLGSFSWVGSRDFIRNRFARVWPVHVLTLNVDLAIAALVGTLGAFDGPKLDELFAAGDPLEVRCDYCSKLYSIARKDLARGGA